MGGESYFCDYCQCYMKCDVNVRKTHNEGMLHRMNKIRYMKRYEDPRKVYEEELTKEICTHHLKGRCRFDMLCQNSHFTPEDLNKLKEIVDIMKEKEVKQKSQAVKDKSKRILIFPWNSAKGNILKLKHMKNLPPSLKPFKIKKIIHTLNFNNTTWG